jgi:HAD superfamily hydrolase (TIGR01484 family)
MTKTNASPTILVSTQVDIVKTALELLKKAAPDTILSREHSEDELLAIFKDVDCIFTDADGTVVEEGHPTFPPIYAEYVQKLADVGVKTILITGKPHTEIMKLVDTLPADLPLSIMYEKGSYFLEADENGDMQKHYLLSSPELEADVLALRNTLLAEKSEIENKYLDTQGMPRVTIGWSGAGAHESLLSLDIMNGTPPENYTELIGTPREAMKLQDPELLAQVEADLQAFVDKHRPGWRLVHIGNSNSEIAPGPIEKDIAIERMEEFQKAKGVLVWGDSNNDLKMFNMRQNPKVHAALVLHRERSLGLVDEVDFVSFGMANAKPFFELLLSLKS